MNNSNSYCNQAKRCKAILRLATKLTSLVTVVESSKTAIKLCKGNDKLAVINYKYKGVM